MNLEEKIKAGYDYLLKSDGRSRQEISFLHMLTSNESEISQETYNKVIRYKGLKFSARDTSTATGVDLPTVMAIFRGDVRRG